MLPQRWWLPVACLHLACAVCAEGEGGTSLFGGFNPPQPGSTGFGFGSGGGSKAKDVEEGGAGEEGGEEIGQELFSGQEVVPVVQLSEVPKQTGEEDENSVFTGEAVCWPCCVALKVFVCCASMWQVRTCMSKQQCGDAGACAAANGHSAMSATVHVRVFLSIVRRGRLSA
jgi:hypothetical protein